MRKVSVQMKALALFITSWVLLTVLPYVISRQLIPEFRALINITLPQYISYALMKTGAFFALPGLIRYYMGEKGFSSWWPPVLFILFANFVAKFVFYLLLHLVGVEGVYFADLYFTIPESIIMYVLGFAILRLR